MSTFPILVTLSTLGLCVLFFVLSSDIKANDPIEWFRKQPEIRGLFFSFAVPLLLACLLKLSNEFWLTTGLFWIAVIFLGPCVLVLGIAATSEAFSERKEADDLATGRAQLEAAKTKYLGMITAWPAPQVTPGPFEIVLPSTIPETPPLGPDFFNIEHPSRGFYHADIEQAWQRAATSSQTVSFGFTDEQRFRHQFVVGATGTGKTTFLSAQIADDLQRVARNEASLFIMDSQNELIQDIANLDVFSSDGPLAGKLIYLEPDPDYPLALNIFDVNKQRMATLSSKDRMMLESGAMWMVEFFLSSLVKSEASPHQDIFLNYLIPALMQIPDATIFTLKELLEPAKSKNDRSPGYERYKQYFGRLRPDHQQWLAERMHSPELAVTRNAIRTRLDGFTARGFFHDMFISPRNKLDLSAELQGSKVILINTMKGLLKNGTEPFGRFFLARLLQATEERMFIDRGARMPVFAYIDEAGDYIREEPNVAELIDKARKQNVALTLSVQRTTDINANVLDALQRAAIQASGLKTPMWNIALDGAEPLPVQVPNVRFQDLPKMRRDEHDKMLRTMRDRFCSSASLSPAAPSLIPSGPDDEPPTRPANY
jgi:hypothetical protein